jgi:DNA-directed RNA polymerase subunit beta
MGKKIGDMLDAYKKAADIKPLRETLDSVYRFYVRRTRPINRDYDDELVVWASNLRRGVRSRRRSSTVPRKPTSTIMLEQAGLDRPVSRRSMTAAPASSSTAR